MAKVYVEFEEPKCCYDCPLFYATEGAYSDRCQLLNEEAEKINIWKEKLENCPLKKVDCSITKEIDYYKSLECHFDEIEEDAKAIAEENEDLKNQIKGFENDFDYQNKVIDKYKEDLKKLRVAYIQAQVANVISGTDFETILKSVLNGENLNG